MLLGGEGEPGVVALAAVGGDDERVEEDFAEAVGGAVAAGEDAHRPVAVAGEGRLEDGRGELHMADRGRREGPRWWRLERDRVSHRKIPRRRARPCRSPCHSTGQMSNQLRPWALIQASLEAGPQLPSS